MKVTRATQQKHTKKTNQSKARVNKKSPPSKKTLFKSKRVTRSSSQSQITDYFSKINDETLKQTVTKIASPMKLRGHTKSKGFPTKSPGKKDPKKSGSTTSSPRKRVSENTREVPTKKSNVNKKSTRNKKGLSLDKPDLELQLSTKLNLSPTLACQASGCPPEPLTPIRKSSQALIATSPRIVGLRSPTKRSTPLSKFDKREEENMDKYIDPARVEDEMFQQDCEILRASFKTGDIDDVPEEVMLRMFQFYASFLKGILNQKVFSSLHNVYCLGRGKRALMEYADGTIILSEANIDTLLRLISIELASDDYDKMNKMDYFHKVALPELIARMLMDVYGISKREAVEKRKELGIFITMIEFNRSKQQRDEEDGFSDFHIPHHETGIAELDESWR